MRLELSIYTGLCSTDKFSINGVEADSSDFGAQQDEDRDGADPYCCGNMQFRREDPTPEVLSKYGITEEEYNEIAEKLEAGLSFGRCGWCE